MRDPELALGHYAAGVRGGLEEFSVAMEAFAQETLKHMALEQNTLIPLAKKYLTAEGWVEIDAAFSGNGDPRFDTAADHQYRGLFVRIVNLAPPPFGFGSAKR